MSFLALALLAALFAAAWYYLWPIGQDGDAHGLTLLCPIRQASPREQGALAGKPLDSIVRNRLQDLPANEGSPFARVPGTYLCRAFVLNDVIFEGGESVDCDHLKSKYLVFSSNYHGDLDGYLRGMWEVEAARAVWEDCVGFDSVSDADSFVKYIRKCQVETTFFFDGSTDQPVEEQLKGLYLKQELSRFAFENQLSASIFACFRVSTRSNSVEPKNAAISKKSLCVHSANG
jgi:hypothetical protein